MVDTSTAIIRQLNTTTNFTDNSNLTRSDVNDESGIEGVIIGVFLYLFLVLVLTLSIWRLRQRERRKTVSDSVDLSNQRMPSESEENEEQFSKLGEDEMSVLYCFLCSDSGSPNFDEKEWLEILKTIRQSKANVSSEEAQQTLNRLMSLTFLWKKPGRIHLTGDARTKIMHFALNHFRIDVLFLLSSFVTAQTFLRYNKRHVEKYVEARNDCGDLCDSLLIRRLQMDVLTHDTIEDRQIFNKVAEILNIPLSIVQGDKRERKRFHKELEHTGENIHCNKALQEASHDHVTWLWRYEDDARPDIVRSCIGRHPHWDIYIIGNKAYRKSNEYHTYSVERRYLLYCLLTAERYSLDVNEAPLKTFNRNYFKDFSSRPLIHIADLLIEIIEKEESKIQFKSDKIRHDVMYAFVTECLVDESDLEYFLKNASPCVVSEYCRSWDYKRKEDERCVYLPKEMYALFINNLKLEILKHSFAFEMEHRNLIIKNLKLPEEILDWDHDARSRYIKCSKFGVLPIHRARAMIVGCARAGKTTLLKRLQKKSLDELEGVKSTVGLEVHENIFEVPPDSDSLRVLTETSSKEGKALLSILDFGGQCAYYACHQVYLSRRAFYILVIDMSKPFEDKVDKMSCDQEGTMFGDWTYGEYLLFWMKSIHIYCDTEAPVILVGTHHDESSCTDKNSDSFFDSVKEYLRFDKNLIAHLDRERCFLLGLSTKDKEFFDNFSKLEKCIVSIAKESRWEESLPADWALSEITFGDFSDKNNQIISKAEFQKSCYGKVKENSEESADVLKLFHEMGILLNFNENNLSDIVIINIQWFVDAFKHIITDTKHVSDNVDNFADWQNFDKTGYLKDETLQQIWLSADFNLGNSKKHILNYMERLGLLVVGDDKHYIPCMNKCTFDTVHQEKLKRCISKTPVLVFRFSILPYFIFFRLVVSCITRTNGEWRVLKDQGLSLLFKNVACFAYKEHDVVLAVNHTSIQVQVFHMGKEIIKKEVTLEVRDNIERLLKGLVKTFHKEIMYTVGYQCSINEVFRQYDECFIEEKEIHQKNFIHCPRHEFIHAHYLSEADLLGYWKEGYDISKLAHALHGDYFIKLYEKGLEKIHYQTFKKLINIGRDAMQIYFDQEISKQELAKMSEKKDKVIKELHLDEYQCARLFPADQSNLSSETFDVTLMYKMLRNRKPSLPEPAKGWGKTPGPHDTSEIDDIERIRIYRNQVSHDTDVTSKLDRKDLEEKGRDLTKAIARLSNGMLNDATMKVLENAT